MINQTNPPLSPHFLAIQGALMHKARNMMTMAVCTQFSCRFDFFEGYMFSKLLIELLN